LSYLRQNRLAIELGFDVLRINKIVLGTRSVIADTALRLSRYVGVSAQFPPGLQAEYHPNMAQDVLGDPVGAGSKASPNVDGRL